MKRNVLLLTIMLTVAKVSYAIRLPDEKTLAQRIADAHFSDLLLKTDIIKAFANKDKEIEGVRITVEMLAYDYNKASRKKLSKRDEERLIAAVLGVDDNSYQRITKSYNESNTFSRNKNKR